MEVVSWNLGITQQHWEQGGSHLNRILKDVGALCQVHGPAVLMLQELGLHEDGLPEDALRERLSEVAPGYEVRAPRLHVAGSLPVLLVGLPA